MAKKNRWRKYFFLTGLLAIAFSVFGYLRLRDFGQTPLQIPATAMVTIAKGDGLNRILPKLRASGITQGWDWQWKVLALKMDMAGRIHVGDYEFKTGTTPANVLAMLASGDTARVKYTLVEGRSFRQMRAELAGLSDLDDDITGKSDSEIMSLLGRQGVHPEGRFLPDTYFVPKSGKRSDLLRQAAEAMDTALAASWNGRFSGLPLKSPDELLTLASIVEKETGKADERPQIAGVFVRRLKKGMRLETDPTVIYGIGEGYDGNIRKKDLQAVTPYNTYRIHGLPPTPIAMPGRAALAAAAHPAAGDTLFFVATGDGGHVFSVTYDQHRKAVKTYQLKP
jgi:UPF0755 protein